MPILLAFSPVLTDYLQRRYPMIRTLEEPGGVVSLEAYADSVGYATIGAGFLISANVAAVLEGMLQRAPTDTEVMAVENAVGIRQPNGTLSSIDFGNPGATTDTTMRNALNSALRSVPGNENLTFEYPTAAAVETTFNLIAEQYEARVNKRKRGQIYFPFANA